MRPACDSVRTKALEILKADQPCFLSIHEHQIPLQLNDHDPNGPNNRYEA